MAADLKPESTTPQATPWWVLVVVAVAVCLAQAGRLDNGYALDDRPLIESPVVASWHNAPQILTNNAMFAAGKPGGSVDTYRPLSILTFVANRTSGVPGLLGYHLTNLLAHLLATWLALVLARRLVPSASAVAMLGAGLFVGLHPAGAEAHVWINGRSDVFMTLAGLASLLAFWAGYTDRTTPAGRGVRWAVAGVLGLTACLFKETWLLVWPAYPVLALVAAQRHADAPGLAPWARWVAVLAPTAGLVAYVAMRLAVLDGVAAGGSDTVADGLRLVAPVWAEALKVTFVPQQLGMRVLGGDPITRDVGHQLWMVVAAALAVAALLVGAHRRGQLGTAVIGVGTLLASMAPIALLATTDWPGFNRYLYVGVAAMAGVVAVLIDTLRPPRARVAVVGALGVTFGLQTAAVVGIYQNMETFAVAAVEESPGVPFGWDLLGQHAIDTGNFALAAQALGRAAELGGNACGILERKALAEVLAQDSPRADATLAMALAQCEHTPNLLSTAALAAMNRDPAAALGHAARCAAQFPEYAPCVANLRRWCAEHPARDAYRQAAQALTIDAPALAARLPAECLLPRSAAPASPPPAPGAGPGTR